MRPQILRIKKKKKKKYIHRYTYTKFIKALVTKNTTKRLKINYIFLFSPFTPDIIITHEYSTQLFYYNSQKSIETSTKRCLNSCIEEIKKEKEEILPLPRETTKQTHRKRKKNHPQPSESSSDYLNPSRGKKDHHQRDKIKRPHHH